MEQEKIRDEHEQVTLKIADLEDILEREERVIEIIQTAESPEVARQELIANYQLSELQANEILSMTLRLSLIHI